MVGVEINKQEAPPVFWLIKNLNQTGYNEKNNTFIFDENSALSPFSKSVGFKITDQVLALDGKTIDSKDRQAFINYFKTIKEGQNVTLTILRKNGDKMDKIDLKGKAIHCQFYTKCSGLFKIFCCKFF
jgi:C-terminal processing protease CtpA/Prc